MPGCCCCCNYNLTKCSTHSATAAPCCLLLLPMQRDGNIDDFNCGIGSRATKCCAVSSACKWRGQSADKERWTVVRKRLTERESERGVTKEVERGEQCVLSIARNNHRIQWLYTRTYQQHLALHISWLLLLFAIAIVAAVVRFLYWVIEIDIAQKEIGL